MSPDTAGYVPTSERLRRPIAHLMNRLPGQCWAALVTWTVGWTPWWKVSRPISAACRADLQRYGTCACRKLHHPDFRACRVCGCTDDDCTQCIEATGVPCSWAEPDLCSRCASPDLEMPGCPVCAALGIDRSKPGWVADVIAMIIRADDLPDGAEDDRG
jgi:hypothetical protein